MLALLLYLPSLLLALGPASVTGLGLWVLAGDRPWPSALLGGDWANQAVELVGASAAPARLGGEASGGVGAAVGLAALTVPLGGIALLLQGLAYNFLAGGILERLRDGAHACFWGGCRRWFWPFLRLGMLGMALFGLLAMIGGLALGPLGTDLAAILGASWLAVLAGWLELARAGMVARAERSAVRALGRATRAVFAPRFLPHLLANWFALGLVGLALLAAQAWALGAFGPSQEGDSALAWVVAAVASQALYLAGAWLKVARLATALALDGESPGVTNLPPAPSLKGRGSPSLQGGGGG